MVQGRKLIALLALDDTGEQPCANRARYAETPALLRQVDMAIALGCESVFLLTQNAADEDALAGQHLSERNGLTFRLLSRPAQLIAAVPADAELVVLMPGALARDTEALETLAGNFGLATIPAEHENAAGMERLDLHRSWAGILRMPGELVSQLEALGPDCEPLSALPRLARSSGIEERTIPPALLKNGRWIIAANGEPRVRIEDTSSTGPAVFRSAANIFAARNLPGLLPFAVMALTILAATAALWLARPGYAILFASVAMAASMFGLRIRDLAEPLQLSALERRDWRDFVAPVPELVAAFALANGIAFSDTYIAAGFAATVTLFLLWIARNLVTCRAQALLAAPVIWSFAGVFGLLGMWWGAAILLAALSLISVALYLRGARRITGF